MHIHGPCKKPYRKHVQNIQFENRENVGYTKCLIDKEVLQITEKEKANTFLLELDLFKRENEKEYNQNKK